MGLLTRYLEPDRPTGGEVDAADNGDTSSPLEAATWPDQAGGAALQATRSQAMQVPALARARNIIAGTVGLLPLAVWTGDGARVRTVRPWIAQPERDLPGAHTLAWTADDLMFYGRSFWQVAEQYREDARPLRYVRVDPLRVAPEIDHRTQLIVGWRIDGKLAPRTGVGRLVVFHGLEEGLLARGGTTIRTALALERAAANYADEPVPQTVLRNTSGAHLPDPKVQELLDKWRTARRTRSTAYLDALELDKVGLDPAGMQLVEARQHVAVEIARLCNIDPSYVGASESGSSLTYANVHQERRKLVDFTLRHYLSAVEGRLTMDDVTTAGQVVRFDLDDFLRADPQVRAQVLTQLTGADVLTIDEAREREGLAPRDNDDQEVGE